MNKIFYVLYIVKTLYCYYMLPFPEKKGIIAFLEP